jgi:Protein of unknown function (DUF732)
MRGGWSARQEAHVVKPAAQDARSSPLCDYQATVKPLIPTLAGLAMMVGVAVPAHADSTDDEFIATIQAAGIGFPDPAQVIMAGKWVCEKAGQGTQMVDVVKDVQRLNPGLSQEKAAKFTAIAANVYCPKALSANVVTGSGGS